MKFYILLLSLCFNFAFASMSNINNETNIYGAKIEVSDKSSSEWQKAVDLALAEVLIKVSGNNAVNTISSIINTKKDASNLVQHFSYSNNTESSQLLEIGFDISAVNEVLSNAGQNIWKSERPKTLVWLFANSGSDYSLLQNDSGELNIFEQAAEKRGIELMFPIKDLQVEQIDFSEGINHVYSLIRQLSAPYKSKQILIGIYDTDSADVTWSFITSDNEVGWHDSYIDKNKGIYGTVNHIVNDMVMRNTVLQDKSLIEKVNFSVKNITSLANFTSLNNSLKKNNTIEKFRPISISKDKVTFEIVVRGGSVALANSLINNDNLHVESDPDAYVDDDMLYVWEHK